MVMSCKVVINPMAEIFSSALGLTFSSACMGRKNVLFPKHSAKVTEINGFSGKPCGRVVTYSTANLWFQVRSQNKILKRPSPHR